jgi:metallo-beta-lactamase family protein
MKLTFIGACRTVTGSQYLIEHEGFKILLECGLYQGHRDEAERINRTFAFKPKDLSAMVLSHAHLDHSGNIPNLAKSGFSGPVYCTPATLDVTRYLLLDAAHIQEADIEHLNKRLRLSNLPVKQPLYTVADTEKALKQFTGRSYNLPFEPVKGLTITFFDAGHILGSALVRIESEGKRVLFSGDLGRNKMPIIKDPVVVPDVDYLMLESTYGNRVHPSPAGVSEDLKKIIQDAIANRGKVIIPAFAVERTQILIKILKELYDAGSLRDVPVYVDSPLATNVTEVFTRHPECFDEETLKIFEAGDPFNFPGLQYIRDKEESKTLNDWSGPLIIIAGSGMCEGGRVLHHLIHSLGRETTQVVLAGFQSPGTLGWRLQSGEKRVPIYNDFYEVKARIHFIGALSAHADGNDLYNYVQAVREHRLQKVFLVHGDIEEAVPLKDRLSRSGIAVDIPESMTQAEIQ